MRTTLELDDKQVRIAQSLTGLTGKSELIRKALKALIEREGTRRIGVVGRHDAKTGKHCARIVSLN